MKLLAALLLIGCPSLAFAQLPLQATPEITRTDDSVNIDWKSTKGSTYFVQYSLDLIEWKYLPVIKAGTGAPIAYGLKTGNDRMFVRLHYTNTPASDIFGADMDGDSISNWDEVRTGGTGTSPLIADTNGDGQIDYFNDRDSNGLADGWELKYFDTIGTATADANIDHDGLTNYEESLVDSDPHKKDSDEDLVDDWEDASPTDSLVDWKRTTTPKFVAIELDIDDIDRVQLVDLSDKGSILFDRTNQEGLTERIVIDKKLVAHSFRYAPEGDTFGSICDALYQDQVLGYRLVSGTQEEGLWNPLDGEFTAFSPPEGVLYHDSFLDVRGAFSAYEEFDFDTFESAIGTPYGSLSDSPESLASAKIETNGNILGAYLDVGDPSNPNPQAGYWRFQNTVDGTPASYGPKVLIAETVVTSPATVVQGEDHWNLIPLAQGLMISKNDGVFQKSDKLKELAGSRVPVGATRHGWLGATQEIWVNGRWYPLKDLISGDIESADLLSIQDNGLAVARIKKVGADPVFALLLPVEVVELSPKLKDEGGKEIKDSEKPVSMPKYNEMVEEIKLVKQYEQNRIAHREMKLKIPGGKVLAGKKVTWTMKAWGVKEKEAVRGDWKHSKVKEHKNRFEESKAYGKYGYKPVDQKSCTTNIEAKGNDGFAAIRVNLPPIGWNHAEVKIKIEGIEGEMSIIRFVVPAVVVIDPGHGGVKNVDGNTKDKNGLKRGASSHNNAKGGWWSVKKTVNGKSRWVDEKSYPKATGILEKTLTLEYGVKLLELLRAKREKDKLSLRIYMTRETDKNPGGYERARLARDKGADVFFSIHFNSAINKSARGALMVIRESGNKNLKEDRAFANRFPDKVAAALVKHDTTARKTARDPSIQSNSMTSDILGFYQDKEYHTIRATIIEVEFIHGEGGDKLINGPTTKAKVKQSVAEAIRDGLLEELNRFKVQND